MNFIDKDTVIILHANNFKDSSYNNYELINNNASIDKEGKFDKCFKFENNSILKLPTSIFNDFRNGDFTLELWLNQTNFNNAYPSPFFLGTGYTTNRGIWCHSKNEFTVGIAFEDNTIATFVLTPNPIQLGKWHHISLVRRMDEYILFIDGLERERQVHAKNVKNPTTDVLIGGTTTANECCNCKIDEFTITKKALWVTNFTPPTSPYTYKDLNNANSIKDINRLDNVLVSNLECLRIDLKDNISYKGVVVSNSDSVSILVDKVNNIKTNTKTIASENILTILDTLENTNSSYLCVCNIKSTFEGSIRVGGRIRNSYEYGESSLKFIHKRNGLIVSSSSEFKKTGTISLECSHDFSDVNLGDTIEYNIKNNSITSGSKSLLHSAVMKGDIL